MKQVQQDTFDIFYRYISSCSEDREEELLDNWSSTVLSTNDYSFESGLLGLGWLIAFLIENDYIEGDADEILEDIDDTVYKLTIREVLEPTTNVTSLLYYSTYYQQRIQYKSNAPFYRRFAHFECMKLLLEKLNSFLLESSDFTSSSILSDQIQVVLKYSYLTKTCINEELVDEAFYTTVERLLDFFEHQQNPAKFEDELAKLYICIRQYENPHWIDRFDHIWPGTKEEDGVPKSTDSSFWSKVSSAFSQNRPVSTQDFFLETDKEKYNIFLYHTNIKPEFFTT